MNTAEVMQSLPGRFRPRMAGNLRAVIQFDLSGPDGGLWHMIIADGACTVAAGQIEDPDVTIIMTAADFVGINLGTVSAVDTFWSGRIELRGDPDPVFALPPIMDWK